MVLHKEKEDAYSQAVASGKYNRENGIHGKYDNVRIYWEDKVTRFFLRPYLEHLIQLRVKTGKKIRILDLGCGSGDGYELLTDINRSDSKLSDNEIHLITDDNLDHYKGIEINKDLLNQNVERWGENSKMQCVWGDFSQGLPVEKTEQPFDIYLTSYGALSHLNEEKTVRLFVDIVNHAENGSILVGDWLGRFSYEWQQLWNNDLSKEFWMDYVISYIYPAQFRDKVELASLNLRLLCQEEINRIIKRVREESGVKLELECLFDRSIFVGRHMDTGDYNLYLKSKQLRRMVNSLFELNYRTDLNQLLIEYHPHSEMSFLNKFFDQLQFCWNKLIQHTKQLLLEYDEDYGDKVNNKTKEITTYPDALLNAMQRMDQTMKGIKYFQQDDLRANIIEPQLAYVLRNLEISLQRGIGTGHSIIGIFTIQK
ncbi:MAG: hypothetical protein ACFFDN_38670 [Candidatus Hodarchaeota archaeon]